MGGGISQPVTSALLLWQQFPAYQVAVAGVNGFRDGMEDDELFFDATGVEKKSPPAATATVGSPGRAADARPLAATTHTMQPATRAAPAKEPPPKWAFFGVFDGHGGPGCSQDVSKAFAKRLQGAKAAGVVPFQDKKEIEDTCFAVDHEVREHVGDGTTGTFCTAVWQIQGDILVTVGNVGDSRIVGCKSGKMVKLTEDHKPTDTEEEKRIQNSGGWVENGRVNGVLGVSRTFGDFEQKVMGPSAREQPVVPLPDVTRDVFYPGDFLALCCDGVFENDAFTRESLVETLKANLAKATTAAHLAQICRVICITAINKGSKDNVTCMLVRFKPETPETPAMASPEHKFVPGPFMLPHDKTFSDTYFAFGARYTGGKSPAQQLALRWDSIVSKATDNPPKEPEAAFFGAGPGAGADVVAWCEKLLTTRKVEKPAPGPTSVVRHEMVAPEALSQQRGFDEQLTAIEDAVERGKRNDNALRKDELETINVRIQALGKQLFELDLPAGDKELAKAFEALVDRLAVATTALKTFKVAAEPVVPAPMLLPPTPGAAVGARGTPSGNLEDKKWPKPRMEGSMWCVRLDDATDLKPTHLHAYNDATCEVGWVQVSLGRGGKVQALARRVPGQPRLCVFQSGMGSLRGESAYTKDQPPPFVHTSRYFGLYSKTTSLPILVHADTEQTFTFLNAKKRYILFNEGHGLSDAEVDRLKPKVKPAGRDKHGGGMLDWLFL